MNSNILEAAREEVQVCFVKGKKWESCKRWMLRGDSIPHEEIVEAFKREGYEFKVIRGDLYVRAKRIRTWLQYEREASK